MPRSPSSSPRKDAARSRAIADALGSLGYPGLMNLFSEMEAEYNHDPGVVLLAALSCDNLDERVVEALPWVVLRFPDIDWRWAVREARDRGVQNRLGYVVGLALRYAASGPVVESERLAQLASLEEQIFDIRAEKEDTLCSNSLPPLLRRSLRDTRPLEARQWNLLTDLTPRDLAYHDL